MRRIFFFSFVSTISLVVFGQSNPLDKASVRCYYQFAQKDQANQLQIDTMTLDIGAQMSEYYDIAKQKQDSLQSVYFSKIDPTTIRAISVLKGKSALDHINSGGAAFSTGRPKESARLYKNRQTGEIVIIDYIPTVPDKYRFVEIIRPQDWQITPDTATILGYPCQKAMSTFRGRNYEAWFSPEIPVNDGPWKFFGLPGLIMKVFDSQNIFSFVCVGIENLVPPHDLTIAQEKFINCSRDELAKIKLKQRGETRISNNGGNIVIASLSAKDNYQSLELE